MDRKTAHDFDQDLLILFDAYVHGGIDRRTFLDRASTCAEGGCAGLSPELADVSNERHLYPGTQHGFNNDTTPRYDAAAAMAWDRTLTFFRQHVRE